ncbi:MAG: CvpA family protein [Sphingobacteriales bacterium]
MNSFYLITGSILLLFSLIGYKAGFIRNVLFLIKITAAIVAAFFLYTYAATIITEVFPSLSVWQYPVAFLICSLSSLLIISLLFIPIKKITQPLHHKLLNKILGILPGLFTGVIIMLMMIRLIPLLDVPQNISDDFKKNDLNSFINPSEEWLENKLTLIFKKPFTQTIAAANEDIVSHGAVTLSFVTDVYAIRPDLEMQLLLMVNRERKKSGLKALLPDPQLTIVAREHSEDMFKRGYFSHNTPDGVDPFQRIHNAKIKYLSAGENLALAQSLDLAHQGLMNSPGHRANILNPDYGRLGIGIVDGGSYGLMITQEFRN